MRPVPKAALRDIERALVTSSMTSARRCCAWCWTAELPRSGGSAGCSDRNGDVAPRPRPGANQNSSRRPASDAALDRVTSTRPMIDRDLLRPRMSCTPTLDGELPTDRRRRRWRPSLRPSGRRRSGGAVAHQADAIRSRWGAIAYRSLSRQAAGGEPDRPETAALPWRVVAATP